MLVPAAPNEDPVSETDATRKNSDRNRLQPGTETEGLVLPYSDILRNNEPSYDNLPRDLRTGGRFHEAIGPIDSYTESMFMPRVNLPLLLRGARPEDAEFKLGRFYLDLKSLSTALLYSDNVDWTEDHRKGDVIGYVGLTTVAMFEISDAVRLGVQGTLVYLPLSNEVGISGFGINDPMAAFTANPLFLTQFTLDQRVGGWDVQAMDEVRVNAWNFGAESSLNLLDSGSLTAEDRAGHYAYRATGTQERNNLGESYIESRNLVGATASRLLPTVTRLAIGAYHANYWYEGVHDSQLPAGGNTLYALLDSERETFRFKPFLLYRALNYDTTPGWMEEVRTGVHGPITENLSFLGDVGYYWQTDGSYTTYLARLRLRHIINPLTYHQLEYFRGLGGLYQVYEDAVTYVPHMLSSYGGDSYLYPELMDTISYRLNHIFAEDLTGQLYASMGNYIDARTGRDTGSENHVAARLNYALGERTTLRVSGAYADIRNGDNSNVGDDNNAGDYNEWIGRVEVFHFHTDSLQTRLIYQYRDRHADTHSDTPGSTFWENLVVLSVTKYF